MALLTELPCGRFHRFDAAPQAPRATGIRYEKESSSRGWLQVLVGARLHTSVKQTNERECDRPRSGAGGRYSNKQTSASPSRRRQENASSYDTYATNSAGQHRKPKETRQRQLVE